MKRGEPIAKINLRDKLEINKIQESHRQSVIFPTTLKENLTLSISEFEESGSEYEVWGSWDSGETLELNHNDRIKHVRTQMYFNRHHNVRSNVSKPCNYEKVF